jgi:glycosyltransferase involved in cell wall biosynthesis
VVLSLDCGGLERVVLDLVREETARGQRADVICLERPGTLAPRVAALGARVLCVQKRPGKRPGAIGRLAAVLRELGPDVVHSHQIGALFYAGPAARWARVPVTVHSEHGRHYTDRWQTRVLGRLSALHAARFFCVSADIAAGVVSHRVARRDKVHVVPNGIDTSRFAGDRGDASSRRAIGIPPGARVVGTVGRLSPVKRQDLLIRAFARSLASVPDAHLLVVGDGPLMGELRDLAASLGIEDRVHFVGYQAEPETLLGAMDLFALTSRSEGMPLVVLEAWAAGLPVIASRVGGLPEMLGDGQAGVLFESGDEAALAAALCELLAAPGALERMGQAGRSKVLARFDARQMADDYERHYVELLETKGCSNSGVRAGAPGGSTAGHPWETS